MKITRRNFIRTTVALGAGGAIAGIDAATPAPGASGSAASVVGTTAQAVRHFAARGYAPAEPEAIISSLPFNGGLNYVATSFDTLDDPQVEVFARRLLLSVDLLRDRAGDIVFNDRHYLQFQEIGPLGINLRERGLGTFDEVETSA